MKKDSVASIFASPKPVIKAVWVVQLADWDQELCAPRGRSEFQSSEQPMPGCLLSVVLAPTEMNSAEIKSKNPW